MQALRQGPIVRNYMTSQLVAVSSETNFDDGVFLMGEKGIGNLPVVENNRPVGILTERQILYYLATSGGIPNKPMKEITLQTFTSIQSDTGVLEAARKMILGKSRLLVFDREQCVGIITASDLVRGFMQTDRKPPLENVMSSDISALQSRATILDAAMVMNRRKIGSVVVLAENGFHVGMFTERDLLAKVLLKGIGLDEKVGNYCSHFMVTARLGITARQAAQIMAANHIKRLPLTENGIITKIVTARDLVDAFQRPE